MNQFTANLDSINRIAFSIGVCRAEVNSDQITPQVVDTYLQLHLSIRDWILWSRLSSVLPIDNGQPDQL